MPTTTNGTHGDAAGTASAAPADHLAATTTPSSTS